MRGAPGGPPLSTTADHYVGQSGCVVQNERPVVAAALRARVESRPRSAGEAVEGARSPVEGALLMVQQRWLGCRCVGVSLVEASVPCLAQRCRREAQAPHAWIRGGILLERQWRRQQG
jgi:hypothetical protein